MNIKEAKRQIQNAMTAYFAKDELGQYCIPIERQRPVFLMGPPGIGKTAIMEQIAAEMGVGLLSYSMTHHTRQSALGLPFIEQRTYGGDEYRITEYTMSEIIASVYDLMETTGVREGILFLDEINCVSETLAPVMLQFLQYKVFGRHRVPDGWIVVTAGNPPEYNSSVREFDMATWDRLKRIDVEPDYEAWKEYASASGVHPAVISYLGVREQDFYKASSTVDGKQFVTARGWEDLSQMIQLYEANNLTVDNALVSQYLQDPKTSRDFSAFYGLFRKYKSDYQIDRILAGKASETIRSRAANARFDERLALVTMLGDALTNEMHSVLEELETLKELTQILVQIRAGLETKPDSITELFSAAVEKLKLERSSGRGSGALSKEEQTRKLRLAAILEEEKALAMAAGGKDTFAAVQDDHTKRVRAQKSAASRTGRHLKNAFGFTDSIFGDGVELLIFLTDLTMNRHAASFIAEYGSPEYVRYSEQLKLGDRGRKLAGEISKLKLK